MAIDLPPDVRDDWQRAGTRTARSRIAVASVTAETTVYEHLGTADALAALGGEAEIPARALFTVEMTFSPSLTAVGVAPTDALGMAAPKARSQFVDTVEDDGIEVREERAAERFEREDGTEARLTILSAAYPIDPTLADGDEATLDAEAHVAVWPTTEAFAMAGGVIPLESPAGTDGLAVDPDRDRRTVLETIASVGLEADAGPESDPGGR